MRLLLAIKRWFRRENKDGFLDMHQERKGMMYRHNPDTETWDQSSRVS